MAVINQHPAIKEAIRLIDEGKLGLAEGYCRDYLIRFPTDVTVIRLLAEVGLKLEILQEAKLLLERCLELAPDFHLARNNYANTLGKMHKFDKALEEFAYLEKVKPNNLSHPVLAASIVVNIGDYAGAISRYEDILQAVPKHAPLQMSYGHALKNVGRQSDSIAAYRRAIALQPTLGEAYWSLENLKTFKFEDGEIEAMRKGLDSPDIDIADRLHLCFSLAKALEDAGEFDESFDYYTRGNEIKIQVSGYDADETTARFENTIEHCSAEHFERKSNFGNPAADPIFIVGLPRSGSTLLE